MFFIIFFFFNDTATTEIYTLSLHDALPISSPPTTLAVAPPTAAVINPGSPTFFVPSRSPSSVEYRSVPSSEKIRSEEHTSELQSRQYLVCRLLLEKKKKIRKKMRTYSNTQV